MAYPVQGKVTLQMRSTNDESFTESPFYINANLLSDNPLPGKTFADINQRLYDSIAQIADMSTGTLVATKVDYSVTLSR